MKRNRKWKILHTVLERRMIQLIQESQIKSKTVMSWSSPKKKEGIFCTVYFVRRIFFNICLCSILMCSVLNTLSKYKYVYISKDITSCTFFLDFKIVESLQCILSSKRQL